MKFGLRSDPSESLARAWAEETKAAINRGIKPAEAGEVAAKNLFPDYRTHTYAAQSDTIEMLLRELDKK